jgi:hypothetical protein
MAVGVSGPGLVRPGSAQGVINYPAIRQQPPRIRGYPPQYLSTIFNFKLLPISFHVVFPTPESFLLLLLQEEIITHGMNFIF